jgi:hypothetical protein
MPKRALLLNCSCSAREYAASISNWRFVNNGFGNISQGASVAISHVVFVYSIVHPNVACSVQVKGSVHGPTIRAGLGLTATSRKLPGSYPGDWPKGSSALLTTRWAFFQKKKTNKTKQKNYMGIITLPHRLSH